MGHGALSRLFHLHQAGMSPG